MKPKRFSLSDVVVLKETDKLPDLQLSKIVGGDCMCQCKVNSSSLAAKAYVNK